jgi:hypothetical protein
MEASIGLTTIIRFIPMITIRSIAMFRVVELGQPFATVWPTLDRVQLSPDAQA